MDDAPRSPFPSSRVGDAFIIPHAQLTPKPFGIRSFDTRSPLPSAARPAHRGLGGARASPILGAGVGQQRDAAATEGNAIDDDIAAGKMAKKMRRHGDVPLSWIPPPAQPALPMLADVRGFRADDAGAGLPHDHLYYTGQSQQDMSVFLGCSFRVGWAPDGTFYHAGRKVRHVHPGGHLLCCCSGELPNEMGAMQWSVVDSTPDSESTTTHPVSHVIHREHLLPQSRKQGMSWHTSAPVSLTAGGISLSLSHTRDRRIPIVPLTALLTVVKGLLERHLDDSTVAQLPASLQEVDENMRSNFENLQAALAQLEKPTGITGMSVRASDAELARVRHHISLWRLVYALWGSTEIVRTIGTEMTLSFQDAVYRRTAMSRWLEEVLQPTSAQQLQALSSSLPAEDAYLMRLFVHLTAHDLPRAVHEALQHKDYRLATLLAQAGNPTTSAADLAVQLHRHWQIPSVAGAVHSGRKRLLRVLSGELEAVITESLTWRQCLGLHVWYLQRAATAVSGEDTALTPIHHTSAGDSVAAYVESVANNTSAPPLLASAGTKQLRHRYQFDDDYDNTDDLSHHDTTFQLLQLYANGEHHLWDLLEPAAMTRFGTDSHTSWHLLTTLQALFGDDLVRMSRTDSRLHYEKWHQLTMSYALQLEALGLWQWALYVLLHLPLPPDRKLDWSMLREHALRHIIDRHGEALLRATPADDTAAFLESQLYLPAAWLSESRALFARYSGEHEAEFEHLLAAGTNAQRISELATCVLAPRYVLSGRLAELEKCMTRVRDSRLAVDDTAAHLFLEYLAAAREAEQYQDLEGELRMRIIDLHTRLTKFFANSPEPLTTKQRYVRAPLLVADRMAALIQCVRMCARVSRHCRVCVSEMCDTLTRQVQRLSQRMPLKPDATISLTNVSSSVRVLGPHTRANALSQLATEFAALLCV